MALKNLTGERRGGVVESRGEAFEERGGETGGKKGGEEDKGEAKGGKGELLVWCEGGPIFLCLRGETNGCDKKEKTKNRPPSGKLYR